MLTKYEITLRGLARKMVSRGHNSLTATWEPSGSVNGLFSKRTVETQSFSGFAPVFVCPSADATSLSEESVIKIDGTNYVIKEIEKKSNGLSIMLLADA